jgi:nitroreductase
MARMGDPTRPNTRQMCAADVGIVSQNISIFCASAKLATVPRAFMEVNELKSILKLTENQVPILNHPVGYFK